VEDHAGHLAAAGGGRHAQRGADQLGVVVLAQAAPGEEVDHGGRVQLPFAGFDLGHVAHPQHVGCDREEGRPAGVGAVHQPLDGLIDQRAFRRPDDRLRPVCDDSSVPPGQRTRGRALGQAVTSRTYTIFQTRSIRFGRPSSAVSPFDS
jgi:hypothetical protein